MKQFSRFLVVGLFNTALGYSIIFACMYLAGMTPEASNVIGYAVGLVASYLLNKSYTFKKDSTRRGEFTKFLVVFALAYGLNFLALLALVHGMEMHQGLSQALAGVVYISVSYLMNKYFVFNVVAR
jgi:putative flippase GtrA